MFALYKNRVNYVSLKLRNERNIQFKKWLYLEYKPSVPLLTMSRTFIYIYLSPKNKKKIKKNNIVYPCLYLMILCMVSISHNKYQFCKLIHSDSKVKQVV